MALLIMAAIWGTNVAAGPAHAQEAVAKPEEQPGETPPLSARYRFAERYSVAPDPKKPDALARYRVGSRETVKVVRDKPQGTPDRDESSLQMIYTERVVKLGKDSSVSGVVRRYDKVNFRTTMPIRPIKIKWLEGMTIFYRLQNRNTPFVLSLTDRSLRQQEYERISQQTFLPVVSMLLPRRPSRVGDTWPVPRPAAWALIGDEPTGDDFNLDAELVEVRKGATGNAMIAVIGVKGQFGIAEGPTAINAQIAFTFEPAPIQQPPSGRPATDVPAGRPAVEPPAAGRTVEGLVDARGFISKIRLAQVITLPLPESDGRLKQSITRELLLERRTSAQPGSGTEDELALPQGPLDPTPANSWLLYDDPQGRFHLLHPQELRVVKVYPEGGIDLLDRRPDGQDVIQLTLIPKTNNPDRDRLAADPIQQKKLLEDQWKKQGEKVVPGPSGWLNDPEWASLKRKVYRTEAALIPAEGDDGAPTAGRIYLDHYIVQFSRNEVLKVMAMTTQDPHVNFSKTAESVIKNFDFGPSEAAGPGATSPASAPPVSTAPLPSPR